MPYSRILGFKTSLRTTHQAKEKETEWERVYANARRSVIEFDKGIRLLCIKAHAYVPA